MPLPRQSHHSDAVISLWESNIRGGYRRLFSDCLSSDWLCQEFHEATLRCIVVTGQCDLYVRSHLPNMASHQPTCHMSPSWIGSLWWWLTTVSGHAANVAHERIWLVHWTVIVIPGFPPQFCPLESLDFSHSRNKSRSLRNIPSSGARLPYHSSSTHPGPITLSGSNILCPLSLKTLSHSTQGQSLCVFKNKLLVSNKWFGADMISFLL